MGCTFVRKKVRISAIPSSPRLPKGCHKVRLADVEGCRLRVLRVFCSAIIASCAFEPHGVVAVHVERESSVGPPSVKWRELYLPASFSRSIRLAVTAPARDHARLPRVLPGGRPARKRTCDRIKRAQRVLRVTGVLGLRPA